MKLNKKQYFVPPLFVPSSGLVLPFFDSIGSENSRTTVEAGTMMPRSRYEEKYFVFFFNLLLNL